MPAAKQDRRDDDEADDDALLRLPRTPARGSDQSLPDEDRDRERDGRVEGDVERGREWLADAQVSGFDAVGQRRDQPADDRPPEVYVKMKKKRPTAARSGAGSQLLEVLDE